MSTFTFIYICSGASKENHGLTMKTIMSVTVIRGNYKFISFAIINWYLVTLKHYA